MHERSVAQVLRVHGPRLTSIPGVVGVAEGETEAGAPCVLVLVEGDADDLRPLLPETLEGYPVRLHPTGGLEARPEGDG